MCVCVCGFHTQPWWPCGEVSTLKARDVRSVGLVVKMSASRAADLGFSSRLCCGHFSGLCHTSDLKIGTPVATLPSTWHERVSVGTG